MSDKSEKESSFGVPLSARVTIPKKDVLLEKTLKLSQIEHICRKQLVRCPATSDQAALKSMAMTIMNIIREN
jgi:hypothetical protein